MSSGIGRTIISSNIWIRKQATDPWVAFRALCPEVTNIEHIDRLRDEGFFVKVHDVPTANADMDGVLLYYPVGDIERGQRKLFPVGRV